MLNLLHLLSNIIFAQAPLTNTLSSHLRRHPNASVTAQSAHLDWQEDQVNVFETEVGSLTSKKKVSLELSRVEAWILTDRRSI